MSFVEVQFPPAVSFGSQGGPEFSTDIIETFSGWEQRNVNWSQSRGRWNVATGIKNDSDMADVIAFFRARRGRAVGFRFKDWLDYRVTLGNIGTADNVQTDFQLRKQYTSGAVTVNRDIKKPVAGTYTIYVGAVAQVEGGGNDYTLDTTTGIVSFNSAPVSGEITATFEFDIPARFDTDIMQAVGDTNDLRSWGNIPIIELRIE